ncbi:MAG: NAD(P)H-binding protein [Kofleriaceae bacterium]|jgi:uncharacterized protein YbjT (DUF2867 family)|nr:NAD(P)H-binding protein [Kofleriaceae bacterium]
MTSTEPARPRRVRVGVWGATGQLGAAVVAEIVAAGGEPVLLGRDLGRLHQRFPTHPAGDVRVARIDDPDGLRAAVAGLDVLIACAGPYGRIGAVAAGAALDAGVDYVDACREPVFAREQYERTDAAARRAGRRLVIGAGADGALTDWAAALAAGAVADADGGGACDDDDPLDDLVVGWSDDPGGGGAADVASRADALTAPTWVWHADRWDEARAGLGVRLGGRGPSLGFAFPLTVAITAPRHLSSRRVTGVVRGRGGGLGHRISQAAALAAPLWRGGSPGWLGQLLGGGAAEAGSAGGDAGVELVRARAARRSTVIEVTIRGGDRVALSAATLIGVAHQLTADARHPGAGVLTAHEAWPAAQALAALSDRGALEVVIDRL